MKKVILWVLIFGLLNNINTKCYSDEETEKESIEKEKKEQKKLNAKLKGDFNFSVHDLKDSLVLITHTKGSGSGFVVEENGKTYVYTNQHVILGMRKFEMQTVSGVTLKYKTMELSMERDLLRMEVDAKKGLKISEKSGKIDDSVVVYGNSSGAGVVTELFGQIQGIGNHCIELSAKFVPGNSGSPIMNVNKEVIGIASHAKFPKKDITVKDTRFSEVRRFAYKVKDVKWMEVKWTNYCTQYCKPFLDNEILIKEIFYVLQIWATNPVLPISDDNLKSSNLKRWASNHNRVVRRFKKFVAKSVATSSKLNSENSRLQRGQKQNAEEMIKYCEKSASRLKFLAKQKNLTKHIKDRMLGYSNTLEYLIKYIHQYGEMLSGWTPFKFKKK